MVAVDNDRCLPVDQRSGLLDETRKRHQSGGGKPADRPLVVLTAIDEKASAVGNGVRQVRNVLGRDFDRGGRVWQAEVHSTMTGVLSGAFWKNFFAMSSGMRTQPCEAL